MNNFTINLIYFLLAMLILITFVHQISLHFNEDYKTEAALLYSSAEKVDFKGVYVRDETVINSTVSGVLSYPWPDGSKIAKDAEIAYIYKDENSIYINQQIEKLESEIKLLENMQNPGTTDVAQPEFISSLIEEKYQIITSLIAKNDLAALVTERKQLQTLMGIYQIVIKEEYDYNSRINELEKELKKFTAKQKMPIDVVTSDNSGYFISYIDGYENVLSPDKISNINAELIQKIVSDDTDYRKKNKYSVGKVVNGYKWSMIGLVNTKEYAVKETEIVRLKFTSTPDIVEAVITNIFKTDDPDISIVVLSCDKLTYNFVQRRVERVELVLNEYEGIKVPRDAIRFNQNNEKGVYILQGEKVAFKKINIIFECDEYLLSDVSSDSAFLSVYDDIIIQGDVSIKNFAETTVTTAVTEETYPVISGVTDTQTDLTESDDEENDDEDSDTDVNSMEDFLFE